MSKTYREFGIVLKKNRLGEADEVVSLLTRDSGVVRAVAKGVRRITSKKGGNVELFNQIDGLFSRGRSLDVLTEATALDTYQHFREDLERVSQAYYVADLTMMLLAEGEVYPFVYDQLASFYAWLGIAPNPLLLVRWYEVQLLSSLGFWSPGRLHSQSENALKLLEQCAVLPVATAAQTRTAPKLSNELERLMRGALVEVLEKEPRSEQFVMQVRELSERYAAG